MHKMKIIGGNNRKRLRLRYDKSDNIQIFEEFYSRTKSSGNFVKITDQTFSLPFSTHSNVYPSHIHSSHDQKVTQQCMRNIGRSEYVHTIICILLLLAIRLPEKI